MFVGHMHPFALCILNVAHVQQSKAASVIRSPPAVVLFAAQRRRAWGRDPVMSEGGGMRRIQPFVIGTRLSAPPDPQSQDQGEPSRSQDQTCSRGLEGEDEEEEEEDSLEPGRGGPRGRQASWELHPGGAWRALVSADVEEKLCPPEMLDQRVLCLSAVHPTLASRLTQKQAEVRDRWHHLLEWRSVPVSHQTLRWLEDSVSFATAGREGGVRTKRPFRKRRSLRRRIYQLLSRCAELCMDLLEAQDLMVLRCEPHSSMMDTLTQQQHTLEAWEEVTRGLAENQLCLQHMENIQRFLRAYLDIM
ncbi:unnamed protein product [Lota lota]